MRSPSLTRSFITCATWPTSKRVTWKPLLRISVANTLANGFIPRLATSPASSTTKETAPIPTIIPLRRRSNGKAAFVTSASVVAAPEAKKAVKIHSDTLSLVISSALMTITLLARPNLIQSCATAIACAVEAQAALMEVAGPRARIHWQKWEWAIIMVFKINSDVKAMGSTSLSLKFSLYQASISALRAGSVIWAINLSQNARTSLAVLLLSSPATRLDKSPIMLLATGKAEVKITPVSSIISAGRPQRSGR